MLSLLTHSVDYVCLLRSWLISPRSERKSLWPASASTFLGLFYLVLLCQKIPTSLSFKSSLSLASVVSLSVGPLPVSWTSVSGFLFNFLYSYICVLWIPSVALFSYNLLCPLPIVTATYQLYPRYYQGCFSSFKLSSKWYT